jgi:uncharacterized protein
VKNANPLSLPLPPRLLALALLGLLVAACGGSADPAKGPFKSVHDHFPIRVGERTLRLQLAVTGMEMQRGLMERPALDPDEGMLFVYRRPQVMSFYMRNTPLPLDIGFFDSEGKLREHYPLHPFDENPVRSRDERLQFALEVRQGWFRENQVRPGTALDLKAVRAALKARGFDPDALSVRP